METATVIKNQTKHQQQIFGWLCNLSNKEQMNIKLVKPFNEWDNLPDSWSILIDRAGLCGAESSLKE